MRAVETRVSSRYRVLAVLLMALTEVGLQKLLDHIDLRQLRRIRKRVLQAEGYGSQKIMIRDEVRALLDGVESEDQSLCVIDGGANIGEYTAEILAQSPSATVLSFEPSPESFQILAARFENDQRVKAIRKALGESSSKQQLFSDYKGSSLSSLVDRDLRHFGLVFGESVEVEVVRLSDWLANNFFQPLALKLDIEGTELRVLEDAVHNIESLQTIAFEFGGANLDSRTIFRDFWNIFSENSWAVYRITTRGLIEISSYSEFDEVYVKCDYVARRRS